MSGPMRNFASTAQRALGGVDRSALRARSSVQQIAASAQYTGRVSGRSISTLERALRMLEAKRRIQTDNSELVASARRARELRAELERLRSVGSGSPVGSPGAGMPGGMKGLGKMAGAAGAALAIAGSVRIVVNGTASIISSGFDAALERSRMSTAINAATHGQGQQAMSMTSDIANKYGLNYNASLEGMRTLTGGLMGLNLPLAEQMKIFEGVSAGVATFGLTAEQTSGAFLALGQMASKGTVSAEELRGQLAERIPGAFAIAARSMNVTEQQLNQMLQKGEIVAADFLPKFAAEMQKTFGADALKNADGPVATLNRFHNAMGELKVTVGQGLMPIITPILQQLTQLASAVLPLIQSGLASVVSWVSNVRGEVSGVLNGTSEWSGYLQPLIKYYGIVWSVVQKVFGAVSHIVSKIVDWVKQSELLKDVFTVVYEIAGAVGKVVGGLVDALVWVFDHTLGPQLERIETVYRGIKSLFGWDGDSKPLTGPSVLDYGYSSPLNLGEPYTAPGVLAAPGSGSSSIAGVSGAGTGSGKVSSPGVTHSGPRSVTIHINREMIGNINLNSLNVKEGVGQVEDILQEMFIRFLASIGTAN